MYLKLLTSLNGPFCCKKEERKRGWRKEGTRVKRFLRKRNKDAMTECVLKMQKKVQKLTLFANDQSMERVIENPSQSWGIQENNVKRRKG